jgi:ABC-2 type transport system ATP-binding protein
MCSHILSDIEVLCDRVAILKKGKLAQVGYLDELRQRDGESKQVEILASGTDLDTLKSHLGTSNGVQIGLTPSGIRLEVPDEKDIDQIIVALRKSGGKLVSVQPVRQSLEELFIDEQPSVTP